MKIKTLVVTLIICSLAAPSLASAKTSARATKLPRIATATANAQATPSICQFSMPEEPLYAAEFLGHSKKGRVALKELFETRAFIQNTGNVPWFSADSGCPSLIVNLGTDMQRDRFSIFYPENLIWKSNWSSRNRIGMDQERVDPGETATFTFWSQAPATDGFYKEYYTPVIEGVTWLDGGSFYSNIIVGEVDIRTVNIELLNWIEQSREMTSLNLTGEKNIEVDVSEQRMRFRIGDIVIRDFPTSTGKPSTPTPYGTTYISFKQDLRIAYAYPHYIMPLWMNFRAGGYGIHSLPSLSFDGGRFWTEARDHIGEARSHGCMRLLPEDAEWAFEFTEVGTRIEVHP